MEIYQFVIDVTKIVFVWGIPAGILIVFCIYLLFWPEKFEKLSSLLWKILRYVYKGAEKKYIAHDIQSRVNDFINNNLAKEIKGFDPIDIKIEWIDENQKEEDFILNGKIVVRMRKSENQNKNFVNASMVFISQNILRKAKRYISQKQKEAINLFTAKKLFEKEKYEVIDQFLQDFLIMKNEDKKISKYFEKFNYIDKAGLFFPVFIQEMTFLGEKVFAQRNDGLIIKEVNELIDFLNNYSKREVGEEKIPKEFDGLYCKFAITIIGKPSKIEREGEQPYINRLKLLNQSSIQTLYLIGKYKHCEFIKQIADNATKDINFSIFNKKKYNAILNYDDGCKINAVSYLVVLASKERKNYFDTEDQLNKVEEIIEKGGAENAK